MSDTLPDYTYAPLEPRHLRILEHQPGDDSDPFVGRITAASIDSDVEYDALSYMWGDATLVDTIVVDGAAVPIAANLAMALRDLRAYMAPEALVIWVDAVCINQNDMDERGHQIGMMRLVYWNAVCVRTWIDATIDEASPAVKALQNFYVPLVDRIEITLGSDNLGLGTDPSF